MADAIKGFHLDDGSLVHYDYRYLDNVVTDSALNQTGVAADGKAVGDAIASVKSGLNLNTITFEASAMTCSTGTIDENTSFVTLVYNDYLVYVHYYLRITDPNGRPNITISGVPSDIIAFQISGYPTHQRVGSTNTITDGSQITHLENANTMFIQCFNFIGSFPEGSGWLTLSGSGMRSTTDVETITCTISDAISDIQSNIEDLSTTRLRYLGTIPETGNTTAAISFTEGSVADIIEEVWEEFPNDGIPFSVKIAANGGTLVVIGVRYSSVYGSVMWSHYLVGSGSVHVNNGTFKELRNWTTQDELYQSFSKAVSANTTTDIGYISIPAGRWLLISHMSLSAGGTGTYNHIVGTRVVRSPEMNGGGSINIFPFTTDHTTNVMIKAYTNFAVTVNCYVNAYRI